MSSEITIREVRLPDDADFVLSLYASTRAAELSLLGWSDDQASAFVRMQLEAQARHYDSYFPDAVSSIVSVDGEPAGRLIVDRSEREIRIVDLALLPEFRGRGVGVVVVRDLFAEADAKGVPIRCHVELDSAARGFWEHLGLVPQGVHGAHTEMERACET